MFVEPSSDSDSSSSDEASSDVPVAPPVEPPQRRGRPRTVGGESWLRQQGLAREEEAEPVPVRLPEPPDTLCQILRPIGGALPEFVATICKQMGAKRPTAAVSDLVAALLGPDAICLVRTALAANKSRIPRTTFCRRLECLAAAVWFGTRRADLHAGVHFA